MSTMPGNPHMSKASGASAQLVSPEIANEHYISEQGITDETMQFGALNRIAEATLALAYEQRTANLIALWSMQDETAMSLDKANGMNVDEWSSVAQQIRERLGL